MHARGASVGAETAFAGACAQYAVWCPRGTSTSVIPSERSETKDLHLIPSGGRSMARPTFALTSLSRAALLLSAPPFGVRVSGVRVPTLTPSTLTPIEGCGDLLAK